MNVNSRPALAKPVAHFDIVTRRDQFMAIKITCPNCGKSGRIDDKLIGARVKCPGCRKPIIIESPDLVLPAPMVEDVGSDVWTIKGNTNFSGQTDSQTPIGCLVGFAVVVVTFLSLVLFPDEMIGRGGGLLLTILGVGVAALPFFETNKFVAARDRWYFTPVGIACVIAGLTLVITGEAPRWFANVVDNIFRPAGR